MGLKFVDNRAGDKMYYCASCYVYLADKAACVSTNFTGTTGQAYLFEVVVNVSFGPMSRREMMTGSHFVRDAFCTHCKTPIGWMYELAPNEKERYKEGSIILERIRILETEGISDDNQLNRRIRRPFDLNNEVVNRIRQGRLELMQIPHNHRNRNHVFRVRRDQAVPVIRIFDEEHIVQTFGYDAQQMQEMRETVDRMNVAMVASSRGNNAELWVMGFRADIALQYDEIREMIDGEAYRPSRAADHNLVQLFGRMRRERDRMHFNNNHEHPELAELDRFFQQRADENQANYEERQRLAAGANLLVELNQDQAPPERDENEVRAERGRFMRLLLQDERMRANRENAERRRRGVLFLPPGYQQPPQLQ